MINNVTLVGRLTRDPNIRTTQSGVTVGQFSLAVDRPFTNQNGEKEADFPNVVVFRKQAELVGKYLSKGRLCGVVGRLQTRKYDKDGQTVFVTEVVADSVQFLDSGNNHQQNNTYQQNSGYQAPQNNGYQPPQQTQQTGYQPPNSYQPQQNNNYQQAQPPQNNAYQPPQQTQQVPNGQNPFANANGPIDISDEDLPF
ncbi:single-stranded DNA-binding protein [Staphylococcus pseudintermedius]|uniref:Single-stranded DNA-binding protein n=1 Tax=Staphylococcus pseudintermedius TaxID=283734 RepID=A0A317ZAZ6_STAPS|nr:single-stranded DNA-binding protein [Staphylococcus pseudintermedius]EGQ0389773.1 single-stranded DNA-binding protein [Staphylococcus pseudintermedius]EGQ1736866.1 single-stranded DNA-binding protein [Staphylococcus pseudintermedius]EGQ2705980.1 single-stranded DNA-binding protein [Staphylococcus pseudintermedius]EGQ3181122.1 single-stranded DNA-binding protein [Staphylococcus pseudintermedius]EGQ3237912.1 single-stranded DNA-binding protein [Staphylococcus pseudintermedius]